MLGTSLKKRALLIKRLIQAVRSLDSRDFDMKGKFGGVLKKLPNFGVILPLNTSKNSTQFKATVHEKRTFLYSNFCTSIISVTQDIEGLNFTEYTSI